MGDFAYPNLLSGTRTGKGWTRVGGTGSYGEGIELRNSASHECYLHSTNVTLKHGVKYSISFDTANTANTAGVDMYVLYDDSTASGWIARERAAIQKGPGGGRFTDTFELPSTSPEGVYNLRFDNNGTTDGKTSLVWFRDIMLCESDVPRAWAPGPDDDWS